MTKNPANRGKLILLFLLGALIGFLKNQPVMSEGFSYLILGIILGFLVEPFRKGVKLIFVTPTNQEIILDAPVEQNNTIDKYENSIFAMPRWANIYNNGSIIMGIIFLCSLVQLFLK